LTLGIVIEPLKSLGNFAKPLSGNIIGGRPQTLKLAALAVLQLSSN
jgi:hypothetical protein